jgi:hypothetical protein
MKEIGRYKLTVDYRYLFAMDTVSGKRYEDMCRLEIGGLYEVLQPLCTTMRFADV